MALSVFDRFPRPACADLRGWTFLDANPAAGTARIAFEGRPEFCSPAGFIQGGMLAAMLDDSMGPAVVVMSEGRLCTATVVMTVSYRAPANPGGLIGEARVVQLGKTVAFLEASLRDGEGTLVA